MLVIFSFVVLFSFYGGRSGKALLVLGVLFAVSRVVFLFGVLRIVSGILRLAFLILGEFE